MLPMRDRSWTRNAHCEHCPSSCRSPGIRPPTRYEGFPRPAEFLPSDPHPLGGLQGLGDNASEKHRHRHPTKLGLMVEPLDQVRMQLRLVRARMWHGHVAELSPCPALTGDGRANVRSLLYNPDWGGIALRQPRHCLTVPEHSGTMRNRLQNRVFNNLEISALCCNRVSGHYGVDHLDTQHRLRMDQSYWRRSIWIGPLRPV